jgi:3-hydroxybutyrate dehydrogenase
VQVARDLEGRAAVVTGAAGGMGRAITARLDQQAKAHGLPEGRVLEEVILAPHAVKRLIEPDEVAQVVAFLLGPGGGAFSGAPVTMDLGWSAR